MLIKTVEDIFFSITKTSSDSEQRGKRPSHNCMYTHDLLPLREVFKTALPLDLQSGRQATKSRQSLTHRLVMGGATTA